MLHSFIVIYCQHIKANVSFFSSIPYTARFWITGFLQIYADNVQYW